jgi:hypothetical protein
LIAKVVIAHSIVIFVNQDLVELYYAMEIELSFPWGSMCLDQYNPLLFMCGTATQAKVVICSITKS